MGTPTFLGLTRKTTWIKGTTQRVLFVCQTSPQDVVFICLRIKLLRIQCSKQHVATLK